MRPLTVLFVCTGNTCRSPLAAGIARLLLPRGEVRFLSAGLQAMPGQPASEGACAAMAERGGALDDHRARPVTLDLLQQADWVVGMTRSHVAIFRQRFAGFYTGKVGLLGEPGRDLSATPATPPAEEVDDPFGGSHEGYRATARQIERLLAGWVEALAAEADGRGGPGQEDAPPDRDEARRDARTDEPPEEWT
ncbi:MAG: low molecular weight protein arginine phosphatase [Candidatus Krumholzibacteriia bacterium]